MGGSGACRTTALTLSLDPRARCQDPLGGAGGAGSGSPRMESGNRGQRSATGAGYTRLVPAPGRPDCRPLEEGHPASVQQPTQVTNTTAQVKVDVQVPGNHSMVSLLGTRDELLKLIEAAFESTVFVRGNEITITGERQDAERVARLFQELISLLDRGSPLTAETVGR